MARAGAGVTTLRIGSRGPAVVNLQRKLAGYGIAADGDFGPLTEGAVRAFQAWAGLDVDGEVGPVTRDALGLPDGPASEPAPTTQPTGGPFAPPFPGWITGVDVSQFQGKIDARALLSAGVSFAFVRASDGVYDVDARWNETSASCAREGLPFGAYGVLEPYGSSRAIAQADHFCRTVEGKLGTLPPVLDFELANNLTGVDALRSAAIWCDRVEKKLGRRVIVYTAPAFFSTLARFAGKQGEPFVDALASRPLWIAHYTGRDTKPPIVPAPWSSWSIWQASGDRPRAGNVGSPNFRTVPWSKAIDLDVNFYRGTIDDLIALGTIGG